MCCEWQSAVIAVTALVHDAIVTVGISFALGLKFDDAVVAARLTILGHAMNNTVANFDRLRDNWNKFKATPLGDLMKQ